MQKTKISLESMATNAINKISEIKGLIDDDLDNTCDDEELSYIKTQLDNINILQGYLIMLHDTALCLYKNGPQAIESTTYVDEKSKYLGFYSE